MSTFCTRCGKRIKFNAVNWLELSSRDGKFYPEGEVAPKDSQGSFPFGPKCVDKPNEPVSR
jgi:hypothetical protein